jgi:gliding motility-associated-like protein
MRIFSFLFLFSFSLIAQQEYDQWRFGYGAGIDFTGGYPKLVSGNSIFSQESAASVADCFGNLLFYTDGETVWSKNDGIMEGGTGLNAVSGTYPSTQGSLIVKRPNSSSIYILFTASDIYGVNYSVINTAANNGLGRVIQKNVKVSNGPTQKLAVTYHQNGTDIWVLTHYENSNKYDAFLVTQLGVSSISVSSETGPIHTSAHGEMKFNQQGTKVAAVVQDQDLVTLADFNNATGRISNSIGISGAVGKPHGCEFSPSGSKMYVTGWGPIKGGVYQFKVVLSNSITLSNERSKISGSFKPMGSLQLAPDNKIYIANDPDLDEPGNRYLGVINYPENEGSTAYFKKLGLYLGSGFSSWQLPNVTLTSKDVYENKSIVSSNYCFTNSTAFSLTNTSGIIDVLWDFDDPNSGIDNYSNEYSPSHVFSKPGTYTVKVTVTSSCEVRDYSQILTIFEGPESNLNALSICAETDYLIGSEGKADVSYNWLPNLGLNNNKLANPIFNSQGLYQDTFQIYYAAESSIGCVTLDTLSLFILPKEKAIEDQTLCPGFDVALGVDSGVVLANWSGTDISNDTSLSPLVDPIISTSYAVQLTDTNGCEISDTVFVYVTPIVPVDAGDSSVICFGDSISIGNNISPNHATFQWTASSDVENSTEAETRAFPNTSKWIYLTASSDTCSSLDSVYLTVHELPKVQLDPKDITVCQKDTISILAFGASTYNWTTSENVLERESLVTAIVQNSFSLIVEGIDSNFCSNYDTASIDVLPIPIPSISSDTVLCLDQSIDLFVKGGISYLWLNGNLAGLTDSTLTIYPKKDQTYRVQINGSNGCFDFDTVSIKINQLPVISLMSDTLICEGSRAYLWARGGTFYNWSPSTYLSSSTGSDLVSTPYDSITYRVQVVDSNGCIDSANTSVLLNVNPIAGFDYDFSATCKGFEVQFSNNSIDGESYNWKFGDGRISNDPSPFHIYDFGTSPKTSLIVGNNDLCFDTLPVSFYWQKISQFVEVFAPNIITPNNDAMNECFEVSVPIEFIDCTDYIIFNRWGMKVFNTRDFDGDFCGVNAYNNQPVSDGTYFYVIEVGDYILNGFIQVIR